MVIKSLPNFLYIRYDTPTYIKLKKKWRPREPLTAMKTNRLCIVTGVCSDRHKVKGF